MKRGIFNAERLRLICPQAGFGGVRTVLLSAAMMTAGHSALVLDQIHHASGDDFSPLPAPSPSQVFGDFPDFSAMVLEDFSVGPAELRLTRVSALFRAVAGFASFQGVSAYQVSIFDQIGLAAGTLSGNVADLMRASGSGVVVTEMVDGSGNHEYGRVDIDVNIELPATGQFWVGIAPVADSSSQFFLQTASPPLSGGMNARFANPGDGFGSGALSLLHQDFAYSVTAVPEPSAFFQLAALGSLVLLHRRSRPPGGAGARIPD